MHMLKWGLLVVVGVLHGCATIIPDFGVKKEFWSDKTPTVGVVVVKLPKAQTLQVGQQGLLDLAINRSMAGGLEERLGKLDVSDINKVADNMTAYLNQKGFKTKRINEYLDLSQLTALEAQNDDTKKIYHAVVDYRPLKTQWGVDKLVVVNLEAIGTVRNYYGFIPIGAPSGYARASGVIINLNNNQLEWKQTVIQSAPSQGEWDAPPDYPGLTNAVVTAYSQVRDLLSSHFAQ